MRVVRTVTEMREATRTLRKGAALQLGFVPTMGALHAGHLSLVRAARRACAFVATSLFVNPLQFGAGEDFTRYPRTFAEDCEQLEREQVDLLFAPTAEEMYPAGATTWVEVGGVGDRLDGASRPGHFRGVATVVAKLFHIVEPDLAYFGQKDAAQVAVLQAMVRDLDFRVRLVVCPTVREPDGLAMSSRNRYLTPAEREQAVTLSRALAAAEQMAQAGETRAERLREAMLQVFQEQPTIRLDYAAVVDAATLEPVRDTQRGALVAVAAIVGNTRLIDNLLLAPKGSPDE